MVHLLNIDKYLSIEYFIFIMIMYCILDNLHLKISKQIELTKC